MSTLAAALHDRVVGRMLQVYAEGWTKAPPCREFFLPLLCHSTPGNISGMNTKSVCYPPVQWHPGLTKGVGKNGVDCPVCPPAPQQVQQRLLELSHTSLSLSLSLSVCTHSLLSFSLSLFLSFSLTLEGARVVDDVYQEGGERVDSGRCWGGRGGEREKRWSFKLGHQWSE
eukprot:262461-Rhodomonas_salina.1